MVAVVLAALGAAGFLEWDKRYGRGSSDWNQARRMAWHATIVRRHAREIRECPLRHSPWRVRFQCPECDKCPFQLVVEAGRIPRVVYLVSEPSERGKQLIRDFATKHHEAAQELEHELSLYEQMSRKYYRSAGLRGPGGVKLTPEEEALIGGGSVLSKNWSGCY